MRRPILDVLLRLACALLLTASLLPAACAKDEAPAARPTDAAYAGDGRLDGYTPTSRPSIVVVDVASARYDAVVPSPGEAVLLPTFAKALAEATSFDNAASPASWGAPALASLLSGLSPGHHTVNGRADEPATLIPAIATLPEMLRAQGWSTHAFLKGRRPFRHEGFDQGFSRWDGAWSGADAAGLAAVRSALAGATAASPAFVLVRLALPLPEEMSAVPGDLATPASDAARAAYAVATRAAETELTLLLDALRAEPAMRDGIVIWTSTHGCLLGEGGGTVGIGRGLSDGAIHVPLGISAPGWPKVRVRGSCSLVDVAPTILDLVGLPRPRGAQGASLAPLVRHPAAAGLPCFAETMVRVTTPAPGVRRLRAVRGVDATFLAIFDLRTLKWEEALEPHAAAPGATPYAPAAAPVPPADLERYGADFVKAVENLRAVLAGRAKQIDAVRQMTYAAEDG